MIFFRVIEAENVSERNILQLVNPTLENGKREAVNLLLEPPVFNHLGSWNEISQSTFKAFKSIDVISYCALLRAGISLKFKEFLRKVSCSQLNLVRFLDWRLYWSRNFFNDVKQFLFPDNKIFLISLLRIKESCLLLLPAIIVRLIKWSFRLLVSCSTTFRRN